MIYTLRFTAPINQSLRTQTPALKLVGVLVHESPTSLVYLHTAHDQNSDKSIKSTPVPQKEALFAMSLTGFRAAPNENHSTDERKRAAAVTLRQPFKPGLIVEEEENKTATEQPVLRPLVLYFEYVEQEPDSNLELEISSQLNTESQSAELKRYISPRTEPLIPGRKTARCMLRPFDLSTKGIHLGLGPVICTITDTKHMPPGRHASSRRTMRFLSTTHCCGLEISPVQVTDAQGNAAGYAQLCCELKVTIRAGQGGDPWISCRNSVRMIHRKSSVSLASSNDSVANLASTFHLSEMGEVRVPLV